MVRIIEIIRSYYVEKKKRKELFEDKSNDRRWDGFKYKTTNVSKSNRTILNNNGWLIMDATKK